MRDMAKNHLIPIGTKVYEQDLIHPNSAKIDLFDFDRYKGLHASRTEHIRRHDPANNSFRLIKIVKILDFK